MPRGRRRKFKIKLNIRPDTVRTVIAVLLLVAAALSLIAFLAPNYSINEKISAFWRGIFGMSAIVVPVLLAMAGLIFIDKLKHKIKEPRIIIGVFLFLITFSSLLHIFVSEDKAYELAKRGGGGGLFGYKAATFLSTKISMAGAVVVLIGLFIISIVLIFDLSLDRVLEFFGSKSDFFSKIPGLDILRKETKLDEESVEITSGTTLGDEDLEEKPDLVTPATQAEEDLEPSFEIIPSMSEPQGSTPASVTMTDGSIETPTLPYTDKVWQNPPLDLLADKTDEVVDNGDVELRKKKITETLKSFGIDAEIVDIKSGPSVTQYSLRAESGVKVSKISGLHNDLALALASPTGSVRIEAPIPGKSLIGIEVPNNNRTLVNFKSLITSEPMKALKQKLGIILGVDVGGRVHVYDVGKMPHMLIAGTTGSGKSVFIHNAIFSMLFRATPQEIKFILIDPKRVELTHYQGIPHLLTPVITEMDKAASAFKWAVTEMERRYKLFESAKARNIESYNEKSGFQALPYIVIIVDELAEIMVYDPAGVEKSIIRIAQLARATGLHLMLAVQRPSTNIITGLIKANIPCRIAFNVASQIDSRVIIDQPGAEKLLGKGDMLFIPPDVSKPFRLQGSFVSDKEISNLVNYLKNQGIQPDYKDEVVEMVDSPRRAVSSSWGEDVDELFDEAVQIVVSAKKASASLLQRKLSIGYARAARIIDELEDKGMIGPPDGSKPREVLIDNIPTKDEFEFSPTIDEVEDTVDSIQEI